MRKSNRLYVLIVVWWSGAAAATGAILIPQYWNFFYVGLVGWVTVGTSTGLLLFEIRRIKHEDRKKNEVV